MSQSTHDQPQQQIAIWWVRQWDLRFDDNPALISAALGRAPQRQDEQQGFIEIPSKVRDAAAPVGARMSASEPFHSRFCMRKESEKCKQSG